MREGWDGGGANCNDAWVDASNTERPSQYTTDAAWATCTNTTGRALKVDATTQGARVRSSWFKLTPITPAQTYCLSVWINWIAGGTPFVDLQTYDAASAAQGDPTRILGTTTAPIDATPGFHRYHQTFTTTPTTHFIHIEQGATTEAPKPGATQVLFDELLITQGACTGAGS